MHVEKDVTHIELVLSTYLPEVKEIHLSGTTLYSSRSDNEDSVVLDGNWFVATTRFPYYHILYDIVGEYEFLKKSYPDLKLGLICGYNGQTKEDFLESLDPGSLLKLIIDEYSATMLHIESTSYKIEKIITLPNLLTKRPGVTDDMPIKSGIQETLDVLAKKDLGPRSYKKLFTKLIRDKLLPMVGESDGPQKIYSVRNGGPVERVAIPEKSSTEFYSRKYGGEHSIKKFFRSKGYVPVDFGKLTFLEQVKFCKNATHFAGIKGSNLLNAIFSKDDCKVYSIAICNFWNYEFEEYFESIGHQVTLINDEIVSAKNYKHSHKDFAMADPQEVIQKIKEAIDG